MRQVGPEPLQCRVVVERAPWNFAMAVTEPYETAYVYDSASTLPLVFSMTR